MDVNRKSIKVNAILNVLKSTMSVIFPLITYPYVLRVLGAEGIGKVNYSNSLISYFSMFAMLGISTYGVREGAKIRNSKAKINQFVREVFTINIISTLLSYCVLLFVIANVEKLKSYSVLIIIQSLTILFTTFGLDWINIIYEDYLFTTIRGFIIHIITLVVMILFIKSPEDYIYYALFTVISSGVICFTNWFYIRKYVHPSITIHPNFRKHIKPLLIMLSNGLAVSIYVNFDTTMLGWMCGDLEVGLYSVSVKIYTIIKNILIAIYAVSMSRLALYHGENRYIDFKNLYTKIWNSLTIILIPSGIGLFCVSDFAMLFMGGKEYLKATGSLQILAIALILAIYGGLVTAVFNNVMGKEKDNLIATIISAIINCCLNFIFIPFLGQYGAAITTLISECFVLCFCILKSKDIFSYLFISDIKKNITDASIGSILIICTNYFVRLICHDTVVQLLLVILIGSMSYFLFLILRKNETFMDLLFTVKNTIRKR